METMESIRERRSVREYTGEPVSSEELDRLLQAARWAPSGLNNQPWRFMKVTDRSLIDGLSELTKYRGVVSGAEALIAVFLDHQEMYDRTKDLQSSGAALQNMLLAAHDMGLGACWLGEILNRREEAEELLGVSGDLEMVAVVALGRPVARERAGVRHPMEDLLIPPPTR
ncbi:MAG: nitroreductase family protein [Actinobacteria bacterium]|nr:nitroreductase family protein [Actinomycetota bacterium]MCG2796879.1 nitroreductase family protein [Actinomycetes bacterium]MBU4241554.1 nitroreductase family protein [Actinomycetota bacterium]MBU4301528.1 nitroreductase family protein [Actinomycetota bacterium]MBU4386286.1 nitroreductase family protein [Actinomycetota bacterium]